MNLIKQMIKINITKTLSKQRRALLRAKGIVPVWNKDTISAEHYIELFTNAAHFGQNGSNISPSLQFMQKRLQESNGLLEIVPKGANIAGTTSKNDFASVSQENFTHALQYSKTEIDMGNFALEDLETVRSQSIDNLSMFEENNKDKQGLSFGENQCSTVSYTETDIFIELPNSGVVGSEKEKVEVASRSASF